MSGPRAGAHDERRIAWSANSRTLPPRVGTDEIASRAGRHGAGRSAGRNHRLPCVTTPPHAPVWWLPRPSSLRLAPEHGPSSLEARGGLRSSPQPAPKLRIRHSALHRQAALRNVHTQSALLPDMPLLASRLTHLNGSVVNVSGAATQIIASLDRFNATVYAAAAA